MFIERKNGETMAQRERKEREMKTDLLAYKKLISRQQAMPEASLAFNY